MVDPILGEQPVIVAQFSYDLDVMKKDGVDVDVEFIYAPNDIFQGDDRPSIQSVSTEAATLDTASAQAGISGTNFSNPLQAVSALAQTVSGNVNKIAATIDSVSFQVDKTVAALVQAGSVKNWSVIQSAKNFKGSLLNAKLSLGGGSDGKNLRTYITTAPISIASLAARLKIRTADLISMNNQIAMDPIVPTNTTIHYFN